MKVGFLNACMETERIRIVVHFDLYLSYSDSLLPDAVRFVEATIPVLMNKAFRNLSKLTNRVKIFRVACLLGVLAEWFTPILSAENAVRQIVEMDGWCRKY